METTHAKQNEDARLVSSFTKGLRNDESAYVDNVAKNNRGDLADILRDEHGQGTVLRLFMGATTLMPLRGLSYVTSALRIAQHVPHEQLQVVFVHELGLTLNGIDRAKARQQAGLVIEKARDMLTANPSQANKTLFAEDSPTDAIAALRPDISDLLEANPKLQLKLQPKGTKHGGDCLSYGAAHIVHQETGMMQPIGLTGDEPPVVQPERIVSIGCQQERLFHSLRMVAREVIDTVEYLPTAQVFTKHLLPPYYMSKEGEQTLADALQHGPDLTQTPNLSVRRDTEHMLRHHLEGGQL